MPATRDLDLGGSTCTVEVESEWKKDDGGSTSPPSVVMETEERESDHGQSEFNENQGSYFNYAYFGVSSTCVET